MVNLFIYRISRQMIRNKTMAKTIDNKLKHPYDLMKDPYFRKFYDDNCDKELYQCAGELMKVICVALCYYISVLLSISRKALVYPWPF